MKFLVVVTPPSIYHCCSTWKTFWEEKLTGKKDLFQSVNMKNCGHSKVSKHKEIKGSDRIITLEISAKFDSLNKMETTSSESKEKLERSGKGLVTALVFKTKVRFPKYKKARYAIENVRDKDLSNIIKEFEKMGKLPYEKEIPKHEPTPSYLHLVRHLAKCMMRSDELNRHVHGSYTENTAMSSKVNVTNEGESKEIIVHKTLSDNQSKDVNKSECNIVHETLSQKNSADILDNVITELKDEEHKETSVTQKVTSYFNILGCGRNLLDQLDVTYQ